MKAKEWFKIEEDSYGIGNFTKEEIAELGPEGRALFRESNFNPNFPKPDMSLWDESLYEGTKIKDNAFN